LSFGNTSKMIDYQTIGFVGKFGYCGIKVYLQYKSSIPHYRDRNFNVKTEKQEKAENLILFNYKREPFTNKKVIQNHILLKDPSKRLKRLLQDTAMKSNVSFYNNDNFLIQQK